MKTAAEIMAETQATDQAFYKLTILLDPEQAAEADYYYQEGVKVDQILALIGKE